MNQIAWLKNNIAEVEQLLAADQEAVRANPGSFSAGLSLKSTQDRLADLRKQLQLETDKREKEVVNFRVMGEEMSRGTIPLDILSKLAQTISESVYSTAYRLLKGRDPHSAIPKKILKTIDLRLAGLEFGSTRLLITSETRANLYGQSLAEDALDAVFSVVSAKTDEEMTDAVAIAGLRASKSISRMCNVLLKHNAQVEMRWNTPAGVDRLFEGTSNRLQKLSLSLAEHTDAPIETIEVTGTMAMAHIRGNFEIESGDKRYRGKYPESLFAKVQSVPIGTKVLATIEKETIENRTTGYLKEVYTLVNIVPCR